MSTLLDFIANNGAFAGRVQLTAGATLAQNDAAQIGYQGKAFPVKVSDYAAVANYTPGTVQSSAATGMICAQTSIVAAQTAALKRNSFVILPDKSFVVAATNDTSGNGCKLYKYTATGTLLSTYVADSTGSGLVSPRLLLLSNGNLAIVWTVGTNTSPQFAIVTPSLTVVKAPTSLGDTSYSTSNHDACALTGGGFAITYQSTTTANERLAIYDNTGTAVLVPTTIQTWTGSAGSVGTNMVALSNGNIAIACNSAFTTTVGTYHGIWGPTGTQIKAFTNLNTVSSSANPPIAMMAGYYAVMMMDATNTKAWVFDNTGTLQGAPYSIANSTGIQQSRQKLLSDGTQFWAIFNNGTATQEQCVKLPLTGTNYVNTNVTLANSLNNYSIAFDAFAENGLIVCASQPTINYPAITWQVDIATGVLVDSTGSYFGSNSGYTTQGVYMGLQPGGDFSFIAVYDIASTAGTNFAIGKYCNTAIIGYTSVGGAAGSPAQIVPTAGAFTVNSIGGTISKSFDHSSTIVYGNRGSLMVDGMTLKGM